MHCFIYQSLLIYLSIQTFSLSLLGESVDERSLFGDGGPPVY